MSRFEIVHTHGEQPWHARFIASNGETVWTTETYVRRIDAVAAVTLVAGRITLIGTGADAALRTLYGGVEVTEVDEA